MDRKNIIGFAALAAFTSGSVFAATLSLPLQKPGLWQQTMTQDGKTDAASSSQVCLDAASEAKLTALGNQISDKNCPSRKVVHNPDGSWSMSGTCSFQTGWKTTSHARLVGDFNSSTTTTIDATTTGAPSPGMNGTHHTVLTATWIGPCKPGQKGGDVIMSNGAKMNMLDAGQLQH